MLVVLNGLAGYRVHLVAAALILVGLGGLNAGADPLPTDSSLTHVANLDHGYGGGLWVRDGYAYASGLSGYFSVIDVRDPANPVEVGRLGLPSRDVDLLDVGNRTIAVLADGRHSIHFVDVSDPHDPVHVSTIALGGHTHNVAALPGTNLVYNSRSSSRGIDIVDVSDPENPYLVKVWNGVQPGCHDVAVYPDAGRAYCAAVYRTYVLDITNPVEPSIIWTVDHPSIQIHHWALANPDHTVLIIGDEAGFWYPEDGCQNSLTTPIGTISDEPGSIWFYDMGLLADVQGEPVEIGHVSLPENNRGPCTAHFGELAGPGLLAVAWYTAGVVTIDFDGPGLPRIVDQWTTPGVNAWDVRYWDGYLFTGDIYRGLDVIKMDSLLSLP